MLMPGNCGLFLTFPLIIMYLCTKDKRNLLRLLMSFLFIGLISCTGEEEALPDEQYIFEVPSNFPSPTYTFDNNPVTKRGFELGRALFYDPVLSRDSSVSCASCHVQAVAFADPQHALSRGVEEREGTRNAPQIANLAFQKELFWDGGITHLDFAPINAITNPLEMDETLANVVQKLNDHPQYPAQFEAAFGSDSVHSANMLHALSQFMVMMVSANSRYDQYVRNEGESLTEEELDGMQIFEEKCSTCHAGTLFNDGSYRNNGLDNDFSKDTGRGIITEVDTDQGKFKVPSLRNVALTKPYMHDGRFKTLEEVLDHYAGGVVASSTLDPLLKNKNQLGIALTENEKQKIILFLETLTDREFTVNPLFRAP
jgi:cytochrome c peroxidase